MPDRRTLAEDVLWQMRLEAELGAAGPRIPRQRQVPPALFVSDQEAADAVGGEEAMGKQRGNIGRMSAENSDLRCPCGSTSWSNVEFGSGGVVATCARCGTRVTK